MASKSALAFLVCMVSTASSSWTQEGSAVDGLTENERFGYSVSLNADGTIKAVGNPKYEETHIRQGIVRVYQYNGGSWNQLGSDIKDSATAQNFRELGYSVSLSDDGTILAVGIPGHDIRSYNMPGLGRVIVYEWDGGDWSQMTGGDIFATQTYGGYRHTGHSVSFSGDGTHLAVGSPTPRNLQEAFSQVQVYKYESGAWQAKGAAIIFSDLEDFAIGSSVSMSYNGSRLAYGQNGKEIQLWEAHLIKNAELDPLSVFVLDYNENSNTWDQVAEISETLRTSADKGGHFGSRAISLSGNGLRLAIGAPGYLHPDDGYVMIFEYAADDPEGFVHDTTYDGNASFGYHPHAGTSVSFNYDGTRLAIGAPGVTTQYTIETSYSYYDYDNFGYGCNSENLHTPCSNVAVHQGYVEILEYAGGLWTSIGFERSGINDVAGWSVSLSSDGEHLAIGTPANSSSNHGSVRVLTYSAPVSASPPSSPPPSADVAGDPHLYFAGGRKADFRGVPRMRFSLLSAPGFAANVHIDAADFMVFDTILAITSTSRAACSALCPRSTSAMGILRAS